MGSPLKPTTSGKETSTQHLQKTFDLLWEDVDAGHFPAAGEHLPAMCHYTSAEVARAVLGHRELWLSCPLYMNDTQELAFAMNEAMQVVVANETLRQACGDGYHDEVVKTYRSLYLELDGGGALDVFIFCMSEFPTSGNVGLLSMWRGYGHDGNGVALVVDPLEIAKANPDCSSFVGKVSYSDNASQRLAIVGLIERLAKQFQVFRPPDSDARDLMVTALFKRVLLFALFTKHSGFSEENEWRLVFLPGASGSMDQGKRCTVLSDSKLPEPRYKAKIIENDAVGIATVVPRVIGGPAYTQPRTLQALKLMIAGIQGTTDVDIIASETPYRGKR